MVVTNPSESSLPASISAFLSVRKQRELRACASPDVAPHDLPASALFDDLLAEHFQFVDFPTPPKQKWVLTKEVLDCFLAKLDPDRDKAGEKYESIRLKLVKYFQWRDSDASDMDADETINRVARRIWEGADISNLNAYIYGVAKLVDCESRKLRNQKRELEEASRLEAPAVEEGIGDPELRKCFDRCLGHLTQDDRETITEYYQFERGEKIQNRKKLAERFGMSPNALRIKAHRQRINLEACVRDCLYSPCA